MLLSSRDKKEKLPKNGFVEDIHLQAFKELIKTGSTEKIDVLNF